MEASTTSSFLLLFLSAALFSSQVGAQKDGPTIGFISPDVVSDIGKSLKINLGQRISFCPEIQSFRV